MTVKNNKIIKTNLKERINWFSSKKRMCSFSESPYKNFIINIDELQEYLNIDFKHYFSGETQNDGTLLLKNRNPSIIEYDPIIVTAELLRRFIICEDKPLKKLNIPELITIEDTLITNKFKDVEKVFNL